MHCVAEMVANRFYQLQTNSYGLYLKVTTPYRLIFVVDSLAFFCFYHGAATIKLWYSICFIPCLKILLHMLLFLIKKSYIRNTPRQGFIVISDIRNCAAPIYYVYLCQSICLLILLTVTPLILYKLTFPINILHKFILTLSWWVTLTGTFHQPIIFQLIVTRVCQNGWLKTGCHI